MTTKKKTTTKKATTKKTTTKKNGGVAKTSTDKLLIRMYNVGFGDCFLIVIPGKQKRTILVDAGFHSLGKGSFSAKELARQVLDDLTEFTGRPRADVVIGTHRHQDHITTFNNEQWEELEVGEVWLPWVEDPDNKIAKKLWKKQTSFALALTDALPSFAAAMSADTKYDIAFALWNAGVPYKKLATFAGWPATEDPAMGVTSNANALARLRTGFASRDVPDPRYLPATDTFPESFQTSALPGVRIHVLGPPRDSDLMEEGNPVGDGESYKALALRDARSQANDQLPPPFGERWIIADTEDRDTLPLQLRELRKLDEVVRQLDPWLAAKALDRIINATSLVLVLQIGSARLLLPGDAEWGTWKLILDEPKAVALLKGTKFLKVGHHGSHNATPKTLIEEILTPDVRAMISTQAGPGDYRNNIPLKGLIEALVEKGIVHARSDKPAAAEKDVFTVTGKQWIDIEIDM